MSFPVIGTTVPTLDNWEYSFRGFQFGSGDDIASVQIDGLGIPKARTGDAARPYDQGEWAGFNFLSGRDLQATAHARGADSPSLAAILQPFQAVFTPPNNGVSEYPFFLQRPGYPLLACMCRPIAYGETSDRGFAYSHIANPVWQMHATDPRLYAPTQRVTAVGELLGLWSFPITFDWFMGGGGLVAPFSATNDGTIETRPTFTITGPCDDPYVKNLTTDERVRFYIHLNEGDQLFIDCLAKSAVVLSEGTTLADSCMPYIQPGSHFPHLALGTNDLVYVTSNFNNASSCVMDFAPAYLAVV